jgi:hypothetical protein
MVLLNALVFVHWDKSWLKFVTYPRLIRRRAEAALWRAAEAEGLPHFMTLRDFAARSSFRQVLDCASPLALSLRSPISNLQWTGDWRMLIGDWRTPYPSSHLRGRRPPRP